MKLKLDENMPGLAKGILISHGHDVTTALEEGLSGKTDATVARIAGREGRMVITMDRRFVDVRRYPPGRHPGFLVVRTDNQSAQAVTRLLASFLGEHNLDDLAGCVVVVEPGAVRIRRASQS